MPQAILYARFSDRPNADDCKSIEAQVDSMEAYAKSSEYPVDGIYTDPAASGRTRKGRDGLAFALEHVCRVRGVLVVYKIDRLSRKLKDLLDISEELQACGAELASVQEHLDSSTAMGRAFFAIMGVIAQLMREENAERTSHVMRHMQKSGLTVSSKPKYGEEFDPASPMGMDDELKPTVPTRTRPCPYEQEIIRMIVGMRAQGMGLNEICRELTAKGKKPRGRKWYHGLIRSILAEQGID